MTLLIVLMYLLGGVSTYRRVGYAYEQWMLGHDHDFKSICSVCTPWRKKCGIVSRDGRNKCYYCNSPVSTSGGVHVSTWLGILPLTLIGWIPIVMFWSVNAVRVKLGIEAESFFKAPPAIETAKERAARKEREKQEKIDEQKKRIAKLEADNARLGDELKSLGIEA